jgi:hypothetical protein
VPSGTKLCSWPSGWCRGAHADRGFDAGGGVDGMAIVDGPADARRIADAAVELSRGYRLGVLAARTQATGVGFAGHDLAQPTWTCRTSPSNQEAVYRAAPSLPLSDGWQQE